MSDITNDQVKHLLRINGVITSKEFGRVFGVGLKMLQKWRREGLGPKYVKVNRHVFYRIEDIDAWLQAQSTDAPDDTDDTLDTAVAAALGEEKEYA